MLRPKILPAILSQTNTAGIKTTLLFNSEGSLLSSTGETADDKLLAAISANIFTSTDKGGRKSLGAETLDMTILDLEKARVAIAGVSKLMICVVADPSVEFGLLRAKVAALKQHLNEPLSQILSA